MHTPRILVGIPCDLHGGYRPFDVALAALQASRAPGEIEIFYAMTGVVVGARNRIVRKALEVGAEYIWFLDDDQPFFVGSPQVPDRPSDLDALLRHDLEAVVPLSLRRGAPFLPLLYDTIEDEWYARQHWLQDHEQGLIKVAGAGMAGLLIKTDVLRRMAPDGWFEFVHPPDNFDDYAEDFPFYRRLGTLGVQLYCDLDVRFGHAVSCCAYPIKQQGKWLTCLADDQPIVMFPQPRHPLAQEADPRLQEAARRQLKLAH